MWILGVENFILAVAHHHPVGVVASTDVLPDIDAASLIVAVLPPTAGDFPPGVTDTVSGKHGLVAVAVYVSIVAGTVLGVGPRRDVSKRRRCTGGFGEKAGSMPPPLKNR